MFTQSETDSDDEGFSLKGHSDLPRQPKHKIVRPNHHPRSPLPAPNCSDGRHQGVHSVSCLNLKWLQCNNYMCVFVAKSFCTHSGAALPSLSAEMRSSVLGRDIFLAAVFFTFLLFLSGISAHETGPTPSISRLESQLKAKFPATLDQAKKDYTEARAIFQR